jgi:hypothetical protein
MIRAAFDAFIDWADRVATFIDSGRPIRNEPLYIRVIGRTLVVFAAAITYWMTVLVLSVCLGAALHREWFN